MCRTCFYARLMPVWMTELCCNIVLGGAIIIIITACNIFRTGHSEVGVSLHAIRKLFSISINASSLEEGLGHKLYYLLQFINIDIYSPIYFCLPYAKLHTLFLEPEGSSSSSQEHVTCPEPEPDKPKPFFTRLFFNIHLCNKFTFKTGSSN